MVDEETHVVVVPHQPKSGPLKAVRRMLIQASLGELSELGAYDAYCALIEEELRDELTSLVGPGWVPVELALAHYRACDQLNLNDKDVHAMGLRTGEKVPSALLVQGTRASVDGPKDAPWSALGAFARMGRRIYEGGSAQYVKLGPKKLLIESTGNPLYGFHHFRIGHAAFMHAALNKIGVEVVDVTLGAYRAAGAVLETRVTWR